MELEKMAEALGNALVESDIYSRYINAREELSKDENLFGRTLRFKKDCFYLHNCSDSDRLDKLKGIYGENYDMVNDKKVKEYLDAELVLCRTVQMINNIIIDKVDMNTVFLDL